MNDDLLRTVPALSWGATTHVGRVRASNEDAFVADPMVFAVADGMGGHQAGEVASAIAANTLRDRLGSGAPSSAVVEAAVLEANAAIFAGAHSNPAQRGMGTTVTGMAVLVEDDGRLRLAVLNVGDSRTYVFRNGRLRRVTVDHSYVQELVDTGHISEAEARRHPRRNIVTRALGIEPSVRVDIKVVSFVRGDRYVICSDGLVDEVDDQEIGEIIEQFDAPQEAADALCAAANRNGGRDNVTVIVLDVLEGEDPPPDEADLAFEPTWSSESAAADADNTSVGTSELAGSTDELPVIPSPAAHAATPVPALVEADPADPAETSVSPGMWAAVRRNGWRPSLGAALFALAVGIIVTMSIVFFLAAGSSDEPPAPTSTSSTSSTSMPGTTSTTVADSSPTGG